MIAVVFVDRPFKYRVEVRVAMGTLVANSTGVIQVTLSDANNDRLTDGVISVTIKRPDTREETATDLSLPHVGNGVYSAQIPKTAVPVPGFNYSAEWSMVAGIEELHPTTYFDVYEG